MEAGPSAAGHTRARHRHELRTLTYVTLDQANGGIVRNLSHDGIAVQAVAAVRPRQQLRVRFELRYPKLRVETRGEVVWSTFSGQCGIRFLDLSPRLIRQIDEWIFGDLLQGLSIPWDSAGGVCIAPLSSLPPKPNSNAEPRAVSARVLQEFESLEGKEKESDLEEVQAEEADRVERDDGLIVSPAPMKVIPLRPAIEPAPMPIMSRTAAVADPVAGAPAILASSGSAAIMAPQPLASTAAAAVPATFPRRVVAAPPVPSPSPARVDLDWLSQPLSGRSLAWTVNTLIVVAALLLFALVFLSITREAPRWPISMASGGVIVIGGLYWAFFRMFGGSSLGTRLARLAGADTFDEEASKTTRFR